MASSKTSLNGYEYGRNPKTTAPFWGDSGEGAEIDDSGTYTDKTWSSQKISDELDEKADASDLASYAKVTSVYTKSESYSKAEVDALIDEIPAVDAYTKAQTDSLLADKANASDVYTKTETDSLLANKAGLNAVYTKGQTDRLLSDKANAADVYTKTQTDSLLANKAGLNAVYTKGQTDRLLSDKANASDVYTKTQTDSLLADYAKVTSVYTKSQTYTKTEVDNLISQAGGGASVFKVKFSPYTIPGVDHKLGRTEQFTHNNYTWYMGGNWNYLPLLITYDDSTEDVIRLQGDFFDVPWNETPSGDDYPSEIAPYKPFVYGELVIKMCLTNNVEVNSQYFADVVLMIESNKAIQSVTMDLYDIPNVVAYDGGMNVYGTPKDVYVDGNAILYRNSASELYYTKLDIDAKVGLNTSSFEFDINIDSQYRGGLLVAARQGNQVEFAFKLKSGVSFTANSMVNIGAIYTDWSNNLPLCSKVNGDVYDDSTYFNIDDAGCIIYKANSSATTAQLYLGFKTNYTSTGNEIIRFTYLANSIT